MTEGKRKQKQTGSEVKTFTVPFAQRVIKENISFTTNASSKPSKEQIINQALKFHSEGNIQEAAKYYQLFINQGFKDHIVFSNYGTILQDIGKLKEAELSYRKAIEIKPDYADAYSNLGVLLNDLGKLQEAELSLRKAIELKPDYANAYFNLSLIQLIQGDYHSGLENYEFRFKKHKPFVPHANTQLKRIDNKQLQKKEKLLVVSEQGFGDTLHYMRYIPYLRNQGFEVSFCAQTKLHSLIKASGIDTNPLTPEQATLVAEGKWIPLLSLPRCLKVSAKNPIVNDPYIFVRNKLKEKWKNILSKEKKLIVAIYWQGSQGIEKKSQKGRSFPLETFGLLLKQNDIKFLSLQKGYGSEQLKDCSFRKQFVDYQSEIDSIWDFEETAAIMESCDIIISNDTYAATMAGGMGKKVWLLLKDIPHWTWGLKNESTLWYPSMRLFRQKERNNWQEVMERVSSKLNNEIGTYQFSVN